MAVVKNGDILYNFLKPERAQARNKNGRTFNKMIGKTKARSNQVQVVFRCIRSSTPDNDFKDYYLRQVVKGKPKLKAIVSTMGKLAEVIYHCFSKEEVYQYQVKYRT